MKNLIRNVRLKVNVAVAAVVLVVLAGVKTVLNTAPSNEPFEPHGPNHRCHDLERHHTDMQGKCNNCECK